MHFSQAIMNAVIPSTFVGPKATFTGMEDPKAYLTTFHTYMMLVGDSDAVRCKLFMSTLVGKAIDWFISLPAATWLRLHNCHSCSGSNISRTAPPTQFLRPLWRKAVSGGDVEGVRESFQGAGGKGRHQGWNNDGSCVSERDLSWPFQWIPHQKPPQDLCWD